MRHKYHAIDSDGHVLEPPDFWDAYIDPAFRDRAPQLFVDTDGKERLRVEDKVLGGPTGLGVAGAIGARQGAAPVNIKYCEGKAGSIPMRAFPTWSLMASTLSFSIHRWVCCLAQYRTRN